MLGLRWDELSRWMPVCAEYFYPQVLRWRTTCSMCVQLKHVGQERAGTWICLVTQVRKWWVTPTESVHSSLQVHLWPRKHDRALSASQLSPGHKLQVWRQLVAASEPADQSAASFNTPSTLFFLFLPQRPKVRLNQLRTTGCFSSTIDCCCCCCCCFWY